MISNKKIVLLSSVFFFMLIIPQDIKGMFLSAFLTVLFAICILKNNSIFRNKKTNIIVTILLLLLNYQFINRWLNTDRINNLALFIGINQILLVVMASVALSILSFPFIYSLTSFVFCFLEEKKNVINITTNKKKIILLCFIFSVIYISICSKSSPLYPFNDWVDSNCYFTVGKSVFSGKVMYRDLFEQKGPLLYFLHSFAYLVSNESFFGVYLIEIVASFLFLYYSYKTMELYFDSVSILSIPILGMLVYSSASFCHGDSAEELCLPIIAYIIYLSSTKIKNNTSFSKKESLLIGILAGSVFWIKFTLVGCFVGMIIIPTVNLLKEHKTKELLGIYLFILFGILISTIPYFIYFLVNNSVYDWLYTYIYCNLFGYTSDVELGFVSKMIYGIKKGLRNIKTFNEINSYIGIIGLLWVYLNKRKQDYSHLLLMVLFSFVFVYIGGKGLAYYSLILCPFIVFGVNIIMSKLGNRLSAIENNKFYTKIIMIISVLLSLSLTSNRYLMFANKEEMPQYRFNNIMSKYDNPTLLNYGFLDGGFYTVSNIVPNCKSFCLTNYPSRELVDLQSYYCENGLCDFVVSRDTELDFDLYELVDECAYYYEREMHTYCLYKLKTL